MYQFHGPDTTSIYGQNADALAGEMASVAEHCQGFSHHGVSRFVFRTLAHIQQQTNRSLLEPKGLISSLF